MLLQLDSCKQMSILDIEFFGKGVIGDLRDAIRPLKYLDKITISIKKESDSITVYGTDITIMCIYQLSIKKCIITTCNCTEENKTIVVDAFALYKFIKKGKDMERLYIEMKDMNYLHLKSTTDKGKWTSSILEILKSDALESDALESDALEDIQDVYFEKVCRLDYPKIFSKFNEEDEIQITVDDKYIYFEADNYETVHIVKCKYSTDDATQENNDKINVGIKGTLIKNIVDSSKRIKNGSIHLKKDYPVIFHHDVGLFFHVMWVVAHIKNIKSDSDSDDEDEYQIYI